MPLTGIEQFHLLSDSLGHPNVLFCRLLVRGTLNRTLLEKAAERVTSRHFIWDRRLVDSNQKPTWVADPNCQTLLLTWMDVGDDQSVDQSFMPTTGDLRTKLDLSSTPGAHIWCQAAGSAATQSEAKGTSQTNAASQSMLFLAIHHSVCDGLGGARIISELLIAHDNLVADRSWDDGLRQLDPTRLSQRHRMGLNRWSYWKHLWKQPIALGGMVKFLFRGFHVIAERETDIDRENINDSQKMGLVGRWISEDLSAGIDHAAAAKMVAVNTIAMAAVFYAIPVWSRQQDNAPAKKWFRMVLPISIASKDDLRSPITNRATIVQVDRCEDQMRDVDSFLHYLDREIKIIVGWQFDKLFLLVVRLMSVSRWWIRRSAANPRARGTIVFTNLGQTFRSVSKRAQKLSRQTSDADHLLEIVDFDFAGPTRSAMPLNFTIQRHQQRYRITARFDRRVLTTDQASSFLNQVEIEMNNLSVVSLKGNQESSR